MEISFEEELGTSIVATTSSDNIHVDQESFHPTRIVPRALFSSANPTTRPPPSASCTPHTSLELNTLSSSGGASSSALFSSANPTARPPASASCTPHTSLDLSTPSPSGGASSSGTRGTPLSSPAPTPAVTGQPSAPSDMHDLGPRWKHSLPRFPVCMNPLLYGEELDARRRKVLTGHLRDYLIRFLDRNDLINNGTTAGRRWAYNALGEALHHAYPDMIFDKGKPGTKIATLASREWARNALVLPIVLFLNCHKRLQCWYSCANCVILLHI
ncbi:uncharacterized protein LOC135367099 [Ornithodoros turicata]|uniref:uncharacterized protein LOC135367099 n=1 Tax=Ornithodoros turicata TaxID=34597 RepID=UPI003139DD01